MDQRSEGSIELDHHVGTLEADGVGDLVAVNRDGDDGGVNQADFNVGIVGLVGDGLAGLGAGASLDALDNQRHFLFGEGFVAVFAAVADGGSVALD